MVQKFIRFLLTFLNNKMVFLLIHVSSMKDIKVTLPQCISGGNRKHNRFSKTGEEKKNIETLHIQSFASRPWSTHVRQVVPGELTQEPRSGHRRQEERRRHEAG